MRKEKLKFLDNIYIYNYIGKIRNSRSINTFVV